MLSENGIEEMDFTELYKENKSFTNEINELLSNIPAYDISGFTVTLFKDGRYGITYYPVEEDEFDEEHEHIHDESCQHEASMSIIMMMKIMTIFQSRVMKKNML